MSGVVGNDGSAGLAGLGGERVERRWNTLGEGFEVEGCVFWYCPMGEISVASHGGWGVLGNDNDGERDDGLNGAQDNGPTQIKPPAKIETRTGETTWAKLGRREGRTHLSAPTPTPSEPQ